MSELVEVGMACPYCGERDMDILIPVGAYTRRAIYKLGIRDHKGLSPHDADIYCTKCNHGYILSDDWDEVM